MWVFPQIIYRPIDGIKSNCPRLIQVLPEKHFPMTAIEIAGFNTIRLRVRPVEFLTKPIDGKAIRRHKPSWYDVRLFGILSEESAFDHL